VRQKSEGPKEAVGGWRGRPTSEDAEKKKEEEKKRERERGSRNGVMESKGVLPLKSLPINRWPQD
jgi:hypothetical protein